MKGQVVLRKFGNEIPPTLSPENGGRSVVEPCWFTKNKTHVFDCHQLRIETWTSGEFPHVHPGEKFHRLGGKNIRHLPKDAVFSQQCQRNARRSLVELETGFCRSREKKRCSIKNPCGRWVWLCKPFVLWTIFVPKIMSGWIWSKLAGQANQNGLDQSAIDRIIAVISVQSSSRGIDTTMFTRTVHTVDGFRNPKANQARIYKNLVNNGNSTTNLPQLVSWNRNSGCHQQ